MTEDLLGDALDQAIQSTLHQDWLCDFTNPYDALESWFTMSSDSRENLEELIVSIDRCFAGTADAQARLALWPDSGLKVEEIDDLLLAMRKRAVDGLAGNPQPMRAP